MKHFSSQYCFAKRCIIYCSLNRVILFLNRAIETIFGVFWYIGMCIKMNVQFQQRIRYSWYLMFYQYRYETEAIVVSVVVLIESGRNWLWNAHKMSRAVVARLLVAASAASYRPWLFLANRTNLMLWDILEIWLCPYKSNKRATWGPLPPDLRVIYLLSAHSIPDWKRRIPASLKRNAGFKGARASLANALAHVNKVLLIFHWSCMSIYWFHN